MASGRGNSKDAPLTKCELLRLENMAKIQEKLASLDIPTLSIPQPKAKKRAKRTHKTNDGETHVHNLRPRPQTDHAVTVNVNEEIEEEEDLECEPIGDFLCDNEDFHSATQKRKGRSISLLKDVFERPPGTPKIKVILNQLGQPVGGNARKFSSAVGCLVRKKLSVGCPDWRKVDPGKKLAIWEDLKGIFDIDDEAFPGFLTNAAKKWKEFKSTLKKQFFHDNLTEDQLRKIHGDRLNDEDWKNLTEYWASEESEARSEQAKASRANVRQHHTSGSRSFACSGHEMGLELGRPPRRDELYIKTHTRKNGVPLQHAGPIIDKLKSIIEERPKLTQRTIQQGDAFAVVCGEKEPKGRVRVLGLGPTPQMIGAPGVRSYTPTRIQMEVLARGKAEAQQQALQQRIMELEEQLLEERMAHERSNMEIISQNGSNSRHHVRPRSENNHVGMNLGAELDEDETYAEHSNDYEYTTVRRHATAPPVQQPPESSPIGGTPSMQPHPFNPTSGVPLEQPSHRQSSLVHAGTLAQQPPESTMRAAPIMQPCPGISTNAAPLVQPSHRQSNLVHAQQPPQSMSADPFVRPCPDIHTRNGGTHRNSHDDYIGREVILYASMKSDQALAKGIVISTNPSTMVAGQTLGRQYCEVVVKVVFKRDAVLPRPYVGVEKMVDAKLLSIAWPYNWLKLARSK